VTSAGRQFDVEVTHAPEPDTRPLEAQVASALRELLKRGTRGDILVFLPGAAEIRRAMERAETIAAEANLLFVPLHGDLSPDAQDLALRPASKQKVIFSTNVAETSVTIEGVEAVVDSGLARVAKHDPWSGRPSLDIAKISRASAAQRAGRAGRLGPGRALRLYTKGDFDTRPEHDAPEILRADLAETALALRAAGIGEASEVKWLDAPPRPALLGAEQLLFRLGAIDEAGRLTKEGREMQRFALPPRLAKLLVESARRGAPRAGAIVAAMLAEGRDVYARSWDAPAEARTGADETSDLLVRLADLEQASDRGLDRGRARQLGLDAGAASSVMRAAEQYARLCRADRSDDDLYEGERDEAIRRAVLAAFPDRVAKRRQDARTTRLGGSREIVMSTGGTATLADTSVVRTAPWLVAVEAGDRSHGAQREKRQTRVWMASAIEPDWLIDLFPGAVEEKIDVVWSGEHERVETFERLVYDRLVLDERPAGAHADEAAASLLAEKALAAGVAAFAGGEAFDRLAERLAFVAKEAPDLAGRAGLEPLDAARIGPLLVATLAGKRSFAEIRAASLLDEIRAAIGFSKLARLDELAPEHVTLGGGRKVKVHYEPGKPPWIESRLQDFFGSSETPKVLGGRVPLVLHLLAPNGRDVQVTTDLAGFWARTYPEVRNELMRRYPRHAWPTDPLTASPPVPRPRGKPS
jgi:ATP-dependent RNA helicase HrpB